MSKGAEDLTTSVSCGCKDGRSETTGPEGPSETCWESGFFKNKQKRGQDSFVLFCSLTLTQGDLGFYGHHGKHRPGGSKGSPCRIYAKYGNTYGAGMAFSPWHTRLPFVTVRSMSESCSRPSFAPVCRISPGALGVPYDKEPVTEWPWAGLSLWQRKW